MSGPIRLNNENIDKLIKGKSPGNYALGKINEIAFIVQYVGRSDVDLNARLKDWVGKYSHFKWKYALSEKEAYAKECINYHDFGERLRLDNDVHPKKIRRRDWQCVVCNK